MFRNIPNIIIDKTFIILPILLIRSMRHLGTHKGTYLAMSEYEAGSIGSRTSSGTDRFNIRACVSAQLAMQTIILEVGK